jgi:hypothetical protein
MLSPMSRTAAAKTPKPTPTSAVSERPNLRECVERARQGRDHAGLEEADRQFGEDLRAELAAIEAGTHPLQRRQGSAQR